MSVKSANQMWKESGTTLTFKAWIEREKQKYSNFEGQQIIINKELNDSIQNVINKSVPSSVSTADDNKTFGIPNVVFVVGGLLIVAAITYKILKNRESK